LEGLVLSLNISKYGETKMCIKVIVRFNVKSSKLDDFTQIMENVKLDLPNVEGCHDVKIYKGSANANLFTLVETWKSKQLHQKHIAKLTADGVWRFISEHLSAEPESDYYRQL
jgi:quinol monooxygenase YgiN